MDKYELALDTVAFMKKIVPEDSKFANRLKSCESSLNFAAPEMFVTHLAKLWEGFSDEVSNQGEQVHIPAWVHVSQTLLIYAMMMLDAPPVERTMVNVPMSKPDRASSRP